MPLKKFRRKKDNYQWIKPLKHQEDGEDPNKVRWAKGWKPNLLFAVIVIAIALILLRQLGVI